jgi:hypothetical protein
VRGAISAVLTYVSSVAFLAKTTHPVAQACMLRVTKMELPVVSLHNTTVEFFYFLSIFYKVHHMAFSILFFIF